MTSRVSDTPIRTWNDFLHAVSTRTSNGAWCFRGQLFGWKLTTSLERLAENLDVNGEDIRTLEWRLFREFQRAYPTSAATSAPERDDILGWWSLMQHHGTPTRLLDWTYSPYVAAHFALTHALRQLTVDRATKCQNATVWLLSTEDVRVDYVAECEREPVGMSRDAHVRKAFKEAMIEGPRPPEALGPRRLGVLSVTPYGLHQRLVTQQGLFVCPRDATASYVANLACTLGDLENTDKLTQIVLEFDREEILNAFDALRRMNVDDATLFPGIDGFARSLVTRADHLRKRTLLGSVKDWDL